MFSSDNLCDTQEKLSPVVYTKGTHEQENPLKYSLCTQDKPILKRQRIAEDFTKNNEDLNPGAPKKHAGDIKNVRFSSKVNTFIYEPDSSIIENQCSLADSKSRSSMTPLIESERCRTISYNPARSIDYENSLLRQYPPDEFKESWVKLDQRILDRYWDCPGIPEIESNGVTEDITDVSEKQLKTWPKLKKPRKMFWNKKHPYSSLIDIHELSKRFQGLKVDPLLLLRKMKKKVQRK